MIPAVYLSHSHMSFCAFIVTTLMPIAITVIDVSDYYKSLLSFFPFLPGWFPSSRSGITGYQWSRGWSLAPYHLEAKMGSDFFFSQEQSQWKLLHFSEVYTSNQGSKNFHWKSFCRWGFYCRCCWWCRGMPIQFIGILPCWGFVAFAR